MKIRCNRPVPLPQPLLAARLGQVAPPLDACSYQKGYQEATLALREELEPYRQLALNTLPQLEAQVQQSLQELKTGLPEVIITLVERIWGKLSLSAPAVKELVDEVLADVSPQTSAITVSLAPADYQALETAGLIQEDPALQFQADPALQHADVQVRTHLGWLDARIGTKINQAAQALRLEN